MVELETLVKPISIADGKGKEIVMEIDTSIKNNNTFYTDSNGLELQTRILNYRATWPVNITEFTSGNYYPVNAMLVIKDVKSNNTVAILNDRTQGGTVLSEGVL